MSLTQLWVMPSSDFFLVFFAVLTALLPIFRACFKYLVEAVSFKDIESVVALIALL